MWPPTRVAYGLTLAPVWPLLLLPFPAPPATFPPSCQVGLPMGSSCGPAPPGISHLSLPPRGAVPFSCFLPSPASCPLELSSKATSSRKPSYLLSDSGGFLCPIKHATRLHHHLFKLLVFVGFFAPPHPSPHPLIRP